MNIEEANVGLEENSQIEIIEYNANIN